MGGYSSERDISIKSGTVVHSYLDRNFYNPYRILISTDEWVCLGDNNEQFPVDKSDFSVSVSGEKINFDCVFNAIHGTPGEEGASLFRTAAHTPNSM